MAKNIDERVVEMRFENKQFEENANKSIKTIGKLNDALDDLNSDRAAKNIERVAKQLEDVDLGKVSDQLNFLEKRFSNFGIIGMTALQEVTKAAINMGKTLYDNTIGQIKSGGMARAMNIENAKFQLEGLKVAWETVSEDIDYAVSGTAYGLDAAAKACAQLTASGVQAGDAMKAALRGISGVAAMTNSSYEEIAPIFTTVAGQGKVMTMQLRQLENRGLNAAAEIGKALGKTEGEIRELVTKGQIDFDTFASAMDSAFGEHAKDANKTFSGALSNMKAALSRIGADFATPYMNMMIKVYNGLRSMFNGIRTELQPIVQFASMAMGKLGDMAESIFGSVHMTQTYMNVVHSLRNILNGLLTILWPIKQAFQDVFPDGFLRTITHVTGEFSKLTKHFGLSATGAQNLRAVFRVLFTAIKNLSTILSTVVKTILPPISTVLTIIFNILGSIGGLITSIIEDISGANGELSFLDVVLTGVSKALQFISTVAAYAAAGIVLLVNAVKDLHIFQTLGAWIVTATTAIKEFIFSIPSLVQYFLQLAPVQAIINGIVTAFKVAGGVIVGAVTGIIFAVTTLINKVKELWTAFINSDKVKGAIEFVKKAITGVKEEFKKVVDDFKNGKSVFSILKDELKRIGEGFENLGKNIKQKFIDLYNSNKFEWLRDIVARFKELLPPAENVQKVLQTTWDILSKNAGKIVAIGYLALITAVTISFKKFLDMATQFTGAAKGLIGNINSLFKPIQKTKTKIQQFTDLILALAGSLTVLTLVNKDGKLKETAIILGSLVGVVTAAVAALSIIDIVAAAKKIKVGTSSITKSMLGLGAGIAALAAGLVVLQYVDFEKGLKGLVLMAGAMAEVVAASFVMSKFNATNKGALMIVALAGAISLMVNSLAKINGINLENLRKDVLALGAIMVSLSLMTKAIGRVKLTNVLALFILTSQIDKIIPVVTRVANALAPAAEKFRESLGRFAESVRNGLSNIKKTIDGIDFIKMIQIFEIKWKPITGIAAIVSGSALAISGAFYLFAKGISLVISSVLNPIFKGMKKFAAGMVILAGAMAIMAKIVDYVGEMDGAKLARGLEAIRTFGAVIGVLMAASIFTNDNKMIKFAAGMVILTGVMALMTKLAKQISEIPEGGIEKGVVVLGAFSAMIAVLEGLSALTGKAKVMPIIALCATIITLSTELVVLSFVPWDDLIGPILGIGTVLVGFAAVLGQLSKVQSTMKKGVSSRVFAELIGIAVIIGELGYAMYKLAEHPWERIAAAGAGLNLAMLGFSAVLNTVSKFKNVKVNKETWGALAEAAVGLIPISAALIAISQLGGDWQKIAAAGAGLALAMVGFGVAIGVIARLTSDIEKAVTVWPTILAFSVGIVAIGYALSQITQFDWNGSIYDAAVALSGVMFALSGAVSIMAKLTKDANALNLGVAAAGIVAISYALTLIIDPIERLAVIEWENLAKAGAVLGALVVSLVALKAIGEGGFAALGELALGIGALGAVTAIMWFIADAIEKLASAFDTFQQSIISFSQNFQLLDGEAIKSNLQAIAEGLQSMVDVGTNFAVVLGYISATGIPAIIALGIAGYALSKILPELNSGLNEFAEAIDNIADIDLGHFRVEMASMADSLWDIVTVAAEGYVLSKSVGVFTQFANALEKMSNNASAVSNMATQLRDFSSALDEAKDAVENSGKEITNYIDTVFTNELATHMENAGKSAADGLVKGIQAGEKIAKIQEAFRSLGTTGLAAFDETVGYASPWWEMAIRGVFGAIGLSDGLTDGAIYAINAATSMGKNTVNAASDTLLNASTGMPAVGEAVSEIAEDVSNTINGLKAKMSEAGGMLSTLASKWTNISISEALKDPMQFIKDNANIPEWLEKIINGESPFGGEGENPLTDLTNGLTGAGKAAGASAADMEKLAKAQESLYKTTDILQKEYGELLETMGITDGIEAAHKELERLGMTVEDFGEMWDGFASSAKSALDNIFDTPADRGWMDKEAILSNMRENLNQVSQWADALGRLAERGLDQGLYQKLAEMGPQGYKYVHAFMEMTDDELSQAAGMYEEALTLPTAAANRISAGFLQTGIMATQGFAAGARRELAEVADAMIEVGDTAEDSLRNRLDTHSPSEVMAAIGYDSDGGYAVGILRGIDQIVSAIEIISNRVILEFNTKLGPEQAKQIGQRFIMNLATGIIANDATLQMIVQDLVRYIILAINNKADQIRQNGRYICQYLAQGFREEMDLQEPQIDDAINLLVKFAHEHATKDHEDDYVKISQFAVETITDELKNKKTTLKLFKDTLDDLLTFIIEKNLRSEETYGMFVDAGGYWMSGLAEGITANAEAAVSAAEEVARQIVMITQSVHETASPSKVAARIGKWWDEGLAGGIDGGAKDVYNSARALADGVVKVSEIAGSKIRNSFYKLFNLSGDQLYSLSTKKVAKTVAALTNSVRVFSITDTVAKAFVPVNKLAGEAADGTSKAVSKITFNLYNANKTVEQQVKKAIKWVNKFDDNLMNLDSAEKVVKPLQKINKYFSDFNQAPKKVISFLDKLKADMRPVNNLVKEMTSNFYHQSEAFKKHTRASNDARIGLLNFGASILQDTEAGKAYIKALEDMARAEEALNDAREGRSDGNIGELEAEFEDAKSKVTSFAAAASNAVKEYRKNLKKALLENMNMFKHFDFGDKINPTTYIGNMLSNSKGVKEWAAGISKLATSGLNANIIKELADENVDSYEKVMALAAANPRTIAILNDLYKQRKKEAKAAAKEVTEALAYSYTDDAKRLRESLQAMLNEGDEAFKQLYQGNLEHYHEFLKEYDAGSAQYTSFIENMQTVTYGFADVIDIAGERLLGFSDASKSTASETIILYDGLINLGDALGVDAEEARRTGTYIEDLTQAFEDWIGVVQEGLQIKNPFESFNEDLTYTTDQLKYNMDSQLTAVKQFAENIHTMQQMGYSSEVIKYIASLGYENGLKYTEGFVDAEKNEVGYFNEAYKEMLSIPDELAKEIGADLLASGTEMGKALQEGVKKAFEEEGVFIPLTDPSKVEEAKEDFTTAGEECAESFEEGYKEKSEYMLVDGIKDQVEDRLPEIKTVYAQAGEEAGKEGAEASVKSTVDTLTSNSSKDQITQAYKLVTIDALKSSVTEGAQEMQTILTDKFNDMGRSVIQPFGDEIVKTLGKGFEDAASKATTSFTTAINKIIEKVKQIPKEVNIKAVVDAAQIDALITKIKEVPQRIDIKVTADHKEVDDTIYAINMAKSYAEDFIYTMNQVRKATEDAAEAAKKAAEAAAEAAKKAKNSSSSTTTSATTTTSYKNSASPTLSRTSSGDSTSINVTINNPTTQSLLEARRTANTIGQQLAQQLG